MLLQLHLTYLRWKLCGSLALQRLAGWGRWLSENDGELKVTWAPWWCELRIVCLFGQVVMTQTISEQWQWKLESLGDGWVSVFLLYALSPVIFGMHLYFLHFFCLTQSFLYMSCPKAVTEKVATCFFFSSKSYSHASSLCTGACPVFGWAHGNSCEFLEAQLWKDWASQISSQLPNMHGIPMDTSGYQWISYVDAYQSTTPFRNWNGLTIVICKLGKEGPTHRTNYSISAKTIWWLYTTRKEDGATPMYWFIMTPY